MTTIFIDTETSGLPKTKGWDNYYDYTDVDKYATSRLVQICWIICEGKEISTKKVYLIRPDGFTIPEATTKIHGISDEHANVHGHLLEAVLKELENDITQYSPKRFVAHNVRFDYHILMSEVHRANQPGVVDLIGNMKLKCTMDAGRGVCKIPSKFNRNKFKSPSLKELYEFLHPGETMELKHQADWDTEHCMKCYFALRDL